MFFLSENWPSWPNLYVFAENQATVHICGGGKWKTSKMCSNPLFLDNLCSIYPIQFSKTVRLPLSWTASILDEINELKILYLVRDPRATLQSRKGRDWCVKTPSCMNPDVLCNDLVNDFENYIKLKKTYPDRLK